MRQAFVDTLCALAAADPRIALLTGDLGYMALEPFRQRFPDRFINVGVAEQNMIGLATGMAEAGFRPYAYSIATFASLRPFEFIRNGPVLHKLPVRIVGMGAGFAYGHAGPSHYGTEDVAVLRTLPGLAVVIPADSAQAAAAIAATAGLDRPVYFSLDKDGPAIPGLNGAFELGHVQLIRKGQGAVILAMGSVTAEALAAADEIDAACAIISSFNPDPALCALLANFRLAVTVEAQARSGGLGALAACVIASHALPCRLISLAVSESPDGTSGSQQDRWRKHGLDRKSILEAM